MMPPVVQLFKCIYGLTQASNHFYDHLSSTLLSLGFKRRIADSEIFLLQRGADMAILTNNVDNIFLAGTKDISPLNFASFPLKTFIDWLLP